MIKLFSGVLLALTLNASTLQAQQACGTYQKFYEVLRDKYKESVRSFGLDGNNNFVAMWGNEETGTWTITVTKPSGQTCLVTSGTDFETSPGELSGEEM